MKPIVGQFCIFDAFRFNSIFNRMREVLCSIAYTTSVLLNDLSFNEFNNEVVNKLNQLIDSIFQIINSTYPVFSNGQLLMSAFSGK